MPWLKDISYDRDQTIKAVRDYYKFLVDFYMEKSSIREPPEGGWPYITQELLGPLGKTDEAIDLLRHLPYIDGEDSDGLPHSAADTRFIDWARRVKSIAERRGDFDPESLRRETEEVENYATVPAHVVGLLDCQEDSDVLYLDTQLGVVYWWLCPRYIRHQSKPEHVHDDPLDVFENWENEEWRTNGSWWAIPDFFEVLKQEFRLLNFVPMSPKEVVRAPGLDGQQVIDDEKLEKRLQNIYREHGRSKLESYNKAECLPAILAALREEDNEDELRVMGRQQYLK